MRKKEKKKKRKKERKKWNLRKCLPESYEKVDFSINISLITCQ